MLDAKFIREHADRIRETIERQKRPELLEKLEKLLDFDEEWRALKMQSDKLRSQRNKLSEEINAAKKAGKDVAAIIQKVKAIPSEIKSVEAKMNDLYEKELLPRLRKIPNLMHEKVPYGKDESENVEIKKWGKTDLPSFPVKNHVELCESLGLADFEASARTTGKGFYYLKGDLGILNQSLIRFAIDTMTKKGFTYVEPPLMVRSRILEAAMDLEEIEQSVYKIANDADEENSQGTDPGPNASRSADGGNQLCLIGTSEHAILGMHAGETITAEELPKKYAGYSMSFRQEIGAHGINEKGLWRTHQFNKVEQFIFSMPEDSWKHFDELLAISEEIMQALKLPYRVIEMCTGDLSVWKSRQYDIEVWRPTTKEYGEVGSLSNCTAYQANDLGIRYVRKNGERGVVHTLNNTAMATSRIMVAILENYQQKDGTVKVPDVLVPYMNGKKYLGK